MADSKAIIAESNIATAEKLRAEGRVLEALRFNRLALQQYLELARSEPEIFRPNVALSLNNLGATLSALGRREEALAAAQEAVQICRALAAARPEASTFDLAVSLNTLANRLSELGRREQALAAA